MAETTTRRTSMTVHQAIELLTKISQKHGNVELFFDCPRCNLSFSPDKVVAAAVHLTGDSK